MNFENIRLEKELYGITGKSFTKALEELDPSENYAGTKLEGLDAFERQLKRFDIKISGSDCDRVEKFFVSTESAVLFPEYIRREIKRGMDECSVIPDIAAAVSYTDGVDYRALVMTEGNASNAVNEGADLPATTVALASTATRLSKFARKLSCTYESVRKQRIEAFGVVLRALGAQISKSCNALAATSLMSGITPTTIAGSTLAYSDLAAFWASMSEADMDVMLCSPAVMAQILAMDEMKYVVSDFMSTGRAVTPYGVTLIKCQALAASNKIIGIDSTKAAEVVFGSDVTVDADRLLTSQKREISCSVSVGVSRISDNAVKVLNAVK